MKLSIIIPCYNAENYISRCVDSILTQEDHKLDLEMLLCNDGSKDNTLEILNLLQEKYPTIIRIDSHENMGVYKTRNRALEIVNGDFIWLIDADDTIKKETISKIERQLSPDLDILSFGYEVEDMNNKFSYYFPPSIKYPSNGLNYLRNNDGRLYLWSNIFNAEFINQNHLRFLGKSMSLEDSFFNLQAFTFANKVNSLNEIVYTYHFNQNSISKKPSLENRIKQGESSINVHLAFKQFKNSFDSKTMEYQIIEEKLKQSVLGFFFSLLKEQYPINYVKKIIKLYTQENFYPIKKENNLNFKAKAFRLFVNQKSLYLYLCKINLIFK